MAVALTRDIRWIRALACGIASPIMAAALIAGPAAAQTVGADGRTLYEATYFQQYGPSTALDIVQRVPGFTLDSGNQDVRGFGQAAGNLVINGQRPSSKSDNLQTILARIPASRVLRVEIGSGDLFGAEFSGKPQVVNLVMTDTGGLAATVEASVRRVFSGRIVPYGNISGLFRSGESTFTASAGVGRFYQVEEGFDRLTALPSGEELEFRRKVNRISEVEPFVTGSWGHAGGDNRTANLNFRVDGAEFVLRQVNDVFPAAGAVRDDRLEELGSRRSYEVGGDVTRPLLGGGIKLVGLIRHRSEDGEQNVFNRIQGQTIAGFAQEVRSVRDERVVRLVWSRNGLGGWTVETGAEGAFNRLRSNVDLFVIDGAGGRTRIDLPVDDAVVRERRGELFVNVGRQLSPAIRIDGGLTYEASRLDVSGDAMAERSLSYLKPKATLDWRPGDGWHMQLSATRTVAQLDFREFISNAELTSDRVNGGNTELVPQRAWEYLVMVERPILGDGLAKVELGLREVSLVQDRVPTPEGFDAPGNLGNGRLRFVRATLNAPLGRLGISGGRLTVDAQLQGSAVRDPYTGMPRQFSGTRDWRVLTQFRQDLSDWAWGITHFISAPTRIYRRDEIDSFDNADPFLEAFIEYRPTSRTTLTLRVDNAADVAATRTRQFFAPDRSSSAPVRFEQRVRDAHTQVFFTVKHSLG